MTKFNVRCSICNRARSPSDTIDINEKWNGPKVHIEIHYACNVSRNDCHNKLLSRDSKSMQIECNKECDWRRMVNATPTTHLHKRSPDFAQSSAV